MLTEGGVLDEKAVVFSFERKGLKLMKLPIAPGEMVAKSLDEQEEKFKWGVNRVFWGERG